MKTCLSAAEIKKKSGLLDHKAMIARTRELFESMSLDIDPLAMVSALGRLL